MRLEQRIQAFTIKVLSKLMVLLFFPVYAAAVVIGLSTYSIGMFITLNIDWCFNPKEKLSPQLYLKMAKTFNFKINNCPQRRE